MTADKGCAECTDWGNGNCASGCFESVATTDPLAPDQQPATQPEATTTAAPPASNTAAATTTSSATDTEEPTVTAEPTADPTPTDIGDVIDEIADETTEAGA